MVKNRLDVVNLDENCPSCKALFSTTMPKKDYELKTGIMHFCEKCSVEIDYHVVSCDKQFLDQLKGQPCKICNYQISDINHIIPKKFGGTDEMGNLVNLCPNHHRAFHVLVSMGRKYRNLKNKYTDNFQLNQQAGIALEIMETDEPMFEYYLSVKPILESNSVFSTDADIFKLVEKINKKKLKIHELFLNYI